MKLNISEKVTLILETLYILQVVENKTFNFCFVVSSL